MDAAQIVFSSSSNSDVSIKVGDDPPCLDLDEEAQRKAWLEEQLEIASQVVILPDERDSRGDKIQQRFIAVDCDLVTESGCCFGGVDVSFPDEEEDGVHQHRDDNKKAVAVYVIMNETGKILYKDSEYFDLTVPYIPSFLAFREIDPLTRLVEKQKQRAPSLTPCAILVDGNGILHPRKSGIASFLGVKTGIPTIGIGKTLFCQGGLSKQVVAQGLLDSLQAASEFVRSSHQEGMTNNYNQRLLLDSKTILGSQNEEQIDVPTTRETATDSRQAHVDTLASHCCGLAVPLGCWKRSMSSEHKESKLPPFETLACALVAHGGRPSSGRRTAGSKNPIYVSVGHKISLQDSVTISASLCFSRIPEPVRQADLIGRDMLRKAAAPVGTKK